MPVKVVPSPHADHPATAGSGKRVHLSQPLRRYLQKIRENLPQHDASRAMEPAAEATSDSPTWFAESKSIA